MPELFNWETQRQNYSTAYSTTSQPALTTGKVSVFIQWVQTSLNGIIMHSSVYHKILYNTTHAYIQHVVLMSKINILLPDIMIFFDLSIFCCYI